jgi:alpha-1,3-rhamnosyltransferase
MKQSLVSVIIPAYNHENYVQECIHSIMNQTYQNIELIVIDDGSKDNTWNKLQEIKHKCEKRFYRVYFETKENEGTCTTLNKLIAQATGEFVYLIASDDVAKPQAIEKEINFLQANPDYVLAVGDNEFINSASERIGWDKYHNAACLSKAAYKTFGKVLQACHKDVDFNSARFGLYETLVTSNYIPNGYLIRKEALDKIGAFTPSAPLEDWWMHLQLSKIGKYKYIDEILFSYRQHDTNTAKKQEYMENISYKTQRYEFNCVKNLEDKIWLDIFNKNINKESVKVKFKLFNWIKFYSLKNKDVRKHILEIFGHKVIVKSKQA